MEQDTGAGTPLHPKQEVRKDSGTPADQPTSPPSIDGYTFRSCALRFVVAALLGMVIDIVIFCLSALAVSIGYRLSVIGLYYALIEVPLICGILGIFFFDEISAVAAEVASKLPRLRLRLRH